MATIILHFITLPWYHISLTVRMDYHHLQICIKNFRWTISRIMGECDFSLRLRLADHNENTPDVRIQLL